VEQAAAKCEEALRADERRVKAWVALMTVRAETAAVVGCITLCEQ